MVRMDNLSAAIYFSRVFEVDLMALIVYPAAFYSASGATCPESDGTIMESDGDVIRNLIRIGPEYASRIRFKFFVITKL